MATPLTFGNPLKFGLDSCHITKGRQISSSTKRESTQSPMWTTPPSYRVGPSNGTLRALELSPWWVVEQGPSTMAVVFPPHFDQGQALTLLFKGFSLFSILLFQGLPLFRFIIFCGSKIPLLYSLASFQITRTNM